MQLEVLSWFMVLNLKRLYLSYKLKNQLHRGKIYIWGLDRDRLDKSKELMSGLWVMNSLVGKWHMSSVFSPYRHFQGVWALAEAVEDKIGQLSYLVKNYTIKLCSQWLDFCYTYRLSSNYNKNDPIGHSQSFLSIFFGSVINVLLPLDLLLEISCVVWCWALEGSGFGNWNPNKTFAASYSTLKLI